MSNETREFVEAFIKVASENLGSREAGESFVHGFIKESADAGFMASMLGGAGKALGAAGVGLAIGALASRTGGSFDGAHKAQLHTKFQNALNQVKATNRVVKAANPATVNSYAETVFRFGPNIAGDANVLASLLANFVQGESIDPMSIKTIVELESRYKENHTPAFV